MNLGFVCSSWLIHKKQTLVVLWLLVLMITVMVTFMVLVILLIFVERATPKQWRDKHPLPPEMSTSCSSLSFLTKIFYLHSHFLLSVWWTFLTSRYGHEPNVSPHEEWETAYYWNLFSQLSYLKEGNLNNPPLGLKGRK